MEDETWVDKVFNFILEDKVMHQAILKELPPDKQSAFIGRKGKITIKGKKDWVFVVRLTSRGLFREDSEDDIRNWIETTVDILREIVIWTAQLPSNPGYSPRAAYVNHLLIIDGESVLYDAEEIFNVLEEHAFAKMGPIAKELVRAMVWEQKDGSQ